jgi:hypothetical protein
MDTAMIFGIFVVGGALTSMWMLIVPEEIRAREALDPFTTALLGGCVAVIGYLLVQVV